MKNYRAIFRYLGMYSVNLYTFNFGILLNFAFKI